MLNVLIALIPAIMIGSLFYFFDKNREPLRLVLRAFLFGILSVLLFVLIHTLLPKLSINNETTLRKVFIEAFYTASFKEEAAKYIAFLFAIYRHRHFNEWYDGILYGSLIGLGFAFTENLLYFIDAKRDLWLLYLGRSVLSMPLHALLGGVMGYFIGKAKFTFDKNATVGLLLMAFLTPFLLHGVFDFVLMYFTVQLAWLSIPMVIFLWGWVFKLKKQTQENESISIAG